MHPADSDPAADPAALRELAERLAREAGTVALAGRRCLPVGQPPAHDTKSSVTDPVTEFDRAAEAHIVAELRRLRPDDAIIGEEGAADSGTSGIAWHIDPIDGTANFLYDLPAWCTSVAAVVADGPIIDALAGAIYLPVTNEMFAAHRGGGATLDGTPVHASGCDDVAMALVGTGFSYLADRRIVQADRISRLLPEVRESEATLYAGADWQKASDHRPVSLLIHPEGRPRSRSRKSPAATLPAAEAESGDE